MMNASVIDNELVEVFVEEAGEVFETIDSRLQVWRDQPTNNNALTEIRRGFHTLKGSGRMVNALDLAEVAWKVENMLNRVIDGSVQATEPVVKLVSTARDLMPKMLDAFKNRRSIGADKEVENLMANADALATGKEPLPAEVRAADVPAALGGDQNLARQLADVNRKLERFHQRSDEALHRSEMALRNARQVAAHGKAMEEQARDRVGRADMNRVIERVNLLAREVMELRRDAKHHQGDNPAHRREINQLVDQRVRDKVAPMERQRKEVEEQLDEARRAASASRSLAWGALVLSMLVGAGAAALLMSGMPLG